MKIDIRFKKKKINWTGAVASQDTFFFEDRKTVSPFLQTGRSRSWVRIGSRFLKIVLLLSSVLRETSSYFLKFNLKKKISFSFDVAWLSIQPITVNRRRSNRAIASIRKEKFSFVFFCEYVGTKNLSKENSQKRKFRDIN